MASELTAARQAMMKSMVRYEAVASDPTAVWRMVSATNYKASYKLDGVQRRLGDLEKQVTGMQNQMNRIEILVQRLVNPQARVVEPRKMRDRAQSGKLEMVVTRRIEDLGQVNLNSTQGVHLPGATEGDFYFPSTGFSVVATGWDLDPLQPDDPRKLPEMVHSGDLDIPEVNGIDPYTHNLPKEIMPADLSSFINMKLEPIEQTVVKAKSCIGDGYHVDRKLRQKLEMTEDEAHFHMKQGAVLYNLEAQMLPKSHHGYFIRLMLEYFKFSSLDADESSACKYVILSKKVLAVFVVMNSTVSSSKEPGNIVFHTLTDAQNFYAMNLWFAEKARMEYLSLFGHLHFLFPEIFKDLNKGVMLGDDVIAQRDLSFLGNLDVGDKVNGAVEFWGVRLDQVRNLLGEITYDSKSCAWMSGVNVTNLDKWRKHDVTEDYLLLLKKIKTKDTELFKENVALCSNANAEKGTTGGNDNQNQTDLFNWEDATEISAEKLREYGCKHSNTGAEVSKDKYGYYQKKKYRRDFLVKFKQKLHANLSKCVFAASHVEYLGLEMNWDANPSIILDIKTRLGVSLPIQVKDIGFTGVLHLIFRPRVNELPCFGAVCFSLRQKKRLDFGLWVIGGEISVIPGISDALEDTIKNAIEDSITWPVRKVIPIIPGDYSDLELKSVGTLVVNLMQARDLTNKDVIGISDPFAILYVRPLPDKIKRSKTINNDLNPIWNEHFEFIVEDADIQSVTVKIYDDDGIQEYELIGCVQVGLKDLQPGKVKGVWMKLVQDLEIQRDRKNRGQVHLELLYCPFDMKNEAMNNYGKDFGQISSWVKSRSYEQCKVFFSKARKSLGLYLIHQGTVDVGLPTNNTNGGRSDNDEACTAEMDSTICSTHSCSKMERDVCPVADGAIQGHALFVVTFKQPEVDGLNGLDEKLLRLFASGSRAVLSPMAAMFGGIVGQEVMKACPGKFHPNYQFFYFDSDESLPVEPLESGDLKPENTRYAAQISVFGSKLRKKLEQAKIFMVGSGTLGCEFLKNLALMGISCSPDGKLTVTDDDVIEKSNLSRQFLFRDWNSGQPKSTVAATVVMAINLKFHVEALQNRASPETENVFNDAFWESPDVVINTLGNVTARMYIDSRCVYFQKPLPESGTLGANCNTHMVIPLLTENYGASRDPPEKQAPRCTVHSFPQNIDYCLTWARSEFEGLLEKNPTEVNAFLSSPIVYAAASRTVGDAQAGNQLERVIECLHGEKCETFQDCITWTRLQFEDYFSSRVKQLTFTFPEDSTISFGVPFWAETFGIPIHDWAQNLKKRVEAVDKVISLEFLIKILEDKYYLEGEGMSESGKH